MKVLAVIPSRIGSTRLERKPLIDINGKTLIHHVWDGVKQSKLVSEIIVATDSKEIFEEVKSFNGNALMTSKNHKTGTDRIAEVAKKNPDYDIVLNIQGDEPLVNGKLVDELIKPLLETDCEMSTIKKEITNEEELNNPAIVKVVCDKNNLALYFSRSLIPYVREGKPKYYKHKGLYGFRREFLLKYAGMQQTSLEKTESLEQLRALENGHKIFVAETNIETYEVNVPEDLEVVKKYLV